MEKQSIPYMTDYTKIPTEEHSAIYDQFQAHDAALVELERLRGVKPISKAKMNEQRVIATTIILALIALWNEYEVSEEVLCSTCGTGEKCILLGLKPYIMANYTPSEARGVASNKTKKDKKGGETETNSEKPTTDFQA
jgi:hypothetical protein